MTTVTGNLTILTDNSVPGKSDLLAEHGFAVYLATSAGNYLFDTGKGRTIVHNANLCQIDLSKINTIILSHGHGDHTGGLPAVLNFKSEVPVWAHPDIFIERFRLDANGRKKYSGIPFQKGFLEKKGAVFNFNSEPVELAPGIHLTGAIPRLAEFETGDMNNRFAERNGQTVEDRIADDQSLILATRRGLLIVLGCAHAGMINVIRHAVESAGDERIYAVVGGTHLDFVDNSQVEKTIAALDMHAIEHLIPSHCTGPRVTARLSREFENCFEFSHVGKSLTF